jgi:hypothetical protein
MLSFPRQKVHGSASTSKVMPSPQWTVTLCAITASSRCRFDRWYPMDADFARCIPRIVGGLHPHPSVRPPDGGNVCYGSRADIVAAELDVSFGS